MRCDIQVYHVALAISPAATKTRIKDFIASRFVQRTPGSVTSGCDESHERTKPLFFTGDLDHRKPAKQYGCRSSWMTPSACVFLAVPLTTQHCPHQEPVVRLTTCSPGELRRRAFLITSRISRRGHPCFALRRPLSGAWDLFRQQAEMF